MDILTNNTRKDWEIAWHIWLQNAATASKWKEATCQRIGMTKAEAVNRAIAKANALVVRYGAPGTAALNVAADSLAILHATVSNGIAPVVIIMKTDLTA